MTNKYYMHYLNFFVFCLVMGPSQALVKIFGDSILASNTPVQHDLEAFAAPVVVQNFAKIGAGMRDGWVEAIPSIYAANMDPVPTAIILDGGGNDVNAVRQDCAAMTSNCNKTIDVVVDLIQTLMQSMKDDGVRNIVYVGFYYIKGFEAAVDYGNEKIQTICSRMQCCYFVDLRTTQVEVGWDGMHPVESSYHAIANRIWEIVQENNVPFV
jgi:hypothetical protein